MSEPVSLDQHRKSKEVKHAAKQAAKRKRMEERQRRRRNTRLIRDINKLDSPGKA
jgi:hypothetical protein